MIGRKMTGDEILQMIEATRKQIDPSALQKEDGCNAPPSGRRRGA